MKRVLLTIMILTALAVFTACSSEEKQITGEVRTNTSAGGSVTEGSNSGFSGTDDSTPASQETKAAVNGYAFVSNGVTVEIDADAAPVIAALGEPVSYFESASCAFEGIDKVYSYDGFEIDTYPSEDGRDLISAVILNSEEVKTAENVRIGDSRDAMIAAYGETEESSPMYYKDSMKMLFIVRDDVIVSIQYLSTVLE